MIKKIIGFAPGVAIPMLLNFVVTILYANVLSAGEYGRLNIYLNTIQIIYAVSLSIFQTASLRFFSLKDEYTEEKEFYSTYLLSNIAATLVLVPICLFIGWITNLQWEIIVLSVGCNGVYQLFCNYYRLNNQSNIYNVFRSVQVAIVLIALLIASRVIDGMTAITPLAIIACSYGVLGVYGILQYRKKLSFKKFSISLVKKSIRYGVPLIGVSVLGYIIASCDQYFLMYYLGEETVGNYALGHRLVDTLIVNMLMMILLVMTPELNKQHDQKGNEESSLMLKKMTNAAVWIIVPLSIAIIIYADFIVKFVFPEYTHAAHIMQLVVFASIFHGVSMFTCKGLELVRKPQYIFYGLLIATIVNCAYNAVFIPVYGVDASAHSSLIAYLIYNIYLVLYTKKFYPIKIDGKYIFKTIFATGVTVGVAIALMRAVIPANLIQLLMELVICAVVYFAVSCLLRLPKVFV